MSHVALAVSSGQVQVPAYSQIEGRVYYLIFHRALRDVRTQVESFNRGDELWSIQAIRAVALGLWQLHKEMIAHQDVKPSNILVFAPSNIKVADLGRSSRKGSPVWHDDFVIAGDRTYASLELLYGYAHTDFAPRRIGADLYMLGNLAAFLLTGVNVTASVLAQLAPGHHPKAWNGTYLEVLPYVTEAYVTVIQALKEELSPMVRQAMLPIIQELCHPDLAKRGAPPAVGRPGQYSLERYVSRLTAIEPRVRLAIRSAAA